MKLLIAAARRLGIAVAIFLDRWIGWHRFPSPIALMLLVGIRSRLRDRNLVHTSLGLPSTAAVRCCPRVGGPPMARSTTSGTRPWAPREPRWDATCRWRQCTPIATGRPGAA
jgi:hypothetical protein